MTRKRVICMGEIKWSLSIPKMQLLQMKKGNMFDPIWLEVEYISLRELLLKYPTINKEETAQGLRDLLKRKGISIKCVQEYLGLAYVQSVYQWLDGKKLPSLDNLYALSQLLQVPLDQLVRGSKKNLGNIWEEKLLLRLKQYQRVFGG